MCLGKVFDEKDPKPLMEDVKSLSQENGKLIFTSIFGDTLEIDGELGQVDFGDSKITIRNKK
ncbi:CooT family nickel-binding protein [Alkalibacter mobilis]|uniref:CooT family nickel-binding protein n=1 Tax=Alkalibacter mobilis TaxID=2787712 RepID=UPI0018A0D5A9|nr:CooT family nickel-binding protein [Alkalibacter mobilis]MBF7096480.1 CooT family nickel-binding protein [Alkalibacter mobilis]